MGKKGTKRKTRWRALSIGEVPSEEESAGQSKGPSKKFNYPSFHHGQNSHQSHNGHSGHSGRHGHNSRLFSSHSTPTRRHAPRSHSSASADTQPKITFNEDEYTRITTPRQDVLFKKGYLSRRKPLPGASLSTEATTSNSASTPSTQSASPEHLLNAESGDGDKNEIDDSYIYLNGFDPNIVYFANGPYPPFDSYGSMMMMPYGGYAPYSSHIEYYPPPGICYQQVPPPYQKRYSVDSQQTNTPETSSPHNEVVQNSQDDSGKQSSKENGIDSEGAQQSGDSCSGLLLNHVTEPPNDHIFIQNHHYMYPGYVFGPQLYNMNGMNIQCANGLSMSSVDPDGKQKYKKKRRRKLRKNVTTNGAAAASDCSENEYSSDSDAVSSISLRASSGSSLLSGPPENDVTHKENEESAPPVLNSVLNTNCSEFIPKLKVYLNADVNEFVPKGFCDEPKNAFEKQIEKFLLPNSDENKTGNIKLLLETENLENIEKKDLSLTTEYEKFTTSSEKSVIPIEYSLGDNSSSQETLPVITAVPVGTEWRTVIKSRSKGKRGKTELSHVEYQNSYLPPTPESSICSLHELSHSDPELTPDESISSPTCTDIVETLKISESSCELSVKSQDLCPVEPSATALKKGSVKTKTKPKNRKKPKGKKPASNTTTSNVVGSISDDTATSVTCNTDAEMSIIKMNDLSPATDTIMEIIPDLPDDNKYDFETYDESSTCDHVSATNIETLEEFIADNTLETDEIHIMETDTISPAIETDLSQNTFNSANEVNDLDECVTEEEDHLVIELNVSPSIPLDSVDAHAELEETSTYVSATNAQYPMTQAVTEWLISKQKEKTPEPILRIPDDSELRQRISSAGLHIGVSKPGEDEESDWSSSYAEESENDGEENDGEESLDNSKNLKSNPLRVSSVKKNKRINEKATNTGADLDYDIRVKSNAVDTDSDYLSDIQDDKRKRVAKPTSDFDLQCNEKIKDKNDLISQEKSHECWEAEISSPKIVTTDSLLNHTRLRKSHVIRSISPVVIDDKCNFLVEQAQDVLEIYESVYGKNVNHQNLSAGVHPHPVPLKGEGPVPPYNGICCSVM